MHIYPHTPHLEYEDSYIHLSKMSLDVKLAKLMLKLTSHIENGDIHITPEERKKWNNMVSRDEYDEFVKTLKKRLGGLETDGEDPAGDDPNDWDDNLFITVRRLALYLQKKGYLTKSLITDLIKSMFKDDPDLSKFLTETLANNIYVRKDQLDALIKQYVNTHKTGEDGLNGKDGKDGKDGRDGRDGVDGATPEIVNGYWYINGRNTGVLARGTSGTATVDYSTIQSILSGTNGLKLDHAIAGSNKIALTFNGNTLSSVSDNIGSGTSTGGKQTIKNFSYFTVQNGSEAPTLPAKPSGDDGTMLDSNWSSTMPNNTNKNQTIWMIWIISVDGEYGEWVGPVCVKSEQQSAGSDTVNQEFIFHLSGLAAWNGNDPSSISTTTTGFLNDGYIPTGWSDHPQGVSDEDGHQFEYMSYRLKTSEGWGAFSKPQIWSSYGKLGLDGDGVQYIFYAGITAPTGSDNNNWPPSWIDDNGYLGGIGSEYIKSNSSWTDDPTNITNGQKQWVSVRKYDGKTKQWGSYSTPALWSYIPNDVVSEGVLTCSPSMLLVLVKDGSSLATTGNFEITWYKDSGVLPITVVTDNIKLTNLSGSTVTNSDGSEIYSKNVTQLDDKTTLVVSFIAGAFKDVNTTYKLIVPVRNDQLNIVRDVVIPVTTTEISTGGKGETGATYNLVLNTHVVRSSDQISSDNPTYIPAKITADCTVENASEEGLTMQYYYNNAWQTLPEAGIKVTADIFKLGVLQMRLMHNGVIVASDSVAFIYDGHDGVSATEYRLSVISCNAAYDGSNSKMTGSYTIEAKYKESGKNWEKWNGVRATYYYQDGTTGSAILSVNNDGSFTDTFTDSDTKRIYNVVVDMVDDSQSVIRSVVIPITQTAKDGTSQPAQTLNSYLRVRTETDTLGKFLDGRTLDESTSTYPQDIVVYSTKDASNTSSWGTYLCIKSIDKTNDTWNSIPNDTEHFSRADYNYFSAFDTIFARKADINSLSAKQIVVLNDNLQIVGGMTSSNVVPENVSDINGNSITANDSVVIWAGTPTTASLFSAPFYVTKDGAVIAKNIYNSYCVADISTKNVYFGKINVELNDGENVISTKSINKTIPNIINISSFVGDRYVILPYPKDYVGKIVTISIVGGVSGQSGACYVASVANDSDSYQIYINTVNQTQTEAESQFHSKVSEILNSDTPLYLSSSDLSSSGITITKSDSSPVRLFALGNNTGSHIEFGNPGTGNLAEYRCENIMSVQLLATKEGNNYRWRVVSGNNDNSNGTILLGGYETA